MAHHAWLFIDWLMRPVGLPHQLQVMRLCRLWRKFRLALTNAIFGPNIHLERGESI